MDKQSRIYKSAKKAQIILSDNWANLYDDLKIEENEDSAFYLVGQKENISIPIKIVVMPQGELSALQVEFEKQNAKNQIYKYIRENIKSANDNDKREIFIDCMNIFIETQIDELITNMDINILKCYNCIYILINSTLHKFSYCDESQKIDYKAYNIVERDGLYIYYINRGKT